MLFSSIALAVPLRLLLVGDTGVDNETARSVSAAITREVTQAGDVPVRVIAMGDLYYDAPPDAADCAEQVATRYQAFYRDIPADAIIGVLGNHDVSNPTETGFSDAARACTLAAYARLGWVAPDSHVVQLDRDGMKVDLAVIDAGFLTREGTHDGATPPKLRMRKRADWRLYTNHYTWKTSTGKCKEAENTWAWLGKPELDLWLNGHAHHLEAIMAQRSLAVTSGTGMEMRVNQPCAGVSGSFFVYVREEAPLGGYIRLDLESKTQARLTPVLCGVDGTCEDKPALVCTRVAEGRGVSCVMESAPVSAPASAPTP